MRYARARLAGLDETGRRGAEARYGAAEQQRILALLNQPPPVGYANWTTPLLVRALCDVREHYIWRFPRAQRIDLPGRKSWCESSAPEFEAKAAEVEPRGSPAIVGFYIAALDNAVVLSVDEKPSIQALERAQGYFKLPTGWAMTGQSHDYKRHGTNTPSAALEVATGKVTGRPYRRRCRVEFLDFMNRSVADDPEREIRVILGNLSTHKPKRDLWLARHRHVHCRYTPTHTSRLNQIGIWFSILSGRSLDGASFHSVDDLKAYISSFIASYNEDARPFHWTKSKIHQKPLKPCFAVQ